MALQVWLPLTKDTNNYGLSQIGSPTVNGLTANTSGKLGGCYKGYSLYHLSEDIIDNEWTIAAWVKSDSWGQYNDIIFCKNVSASNDCQIYFSIVSGNSLNIGINGPSGSMAYGYTFSTNTWYHIAATYNGSKCAMYINGTKVKEGTDTTAKPTGRLNICVGGRSTNAGGTSVTGMQSYINDLRLYDHAISPREVAELAKGLVLHYPLNDSYIEPTTNLCTTQAGGWNNSGTCVRNTDDTSILNKPTPGPVYSLTATSDGSMAISLGNTTANLPSKTLVASVYCWLDGTQDSQVVYLRSQSSDGSVGNLMYNGDLNPLTWPKKRWIRLVSSPITTASNATKFYICTYVNKNTEVRAFNGWQIEENTHVTDWVAPGTTRAASTIVYDTSGYGHNADIINSPTCTADTPRYQTAIHMTAKNQKLHVSNLVTSGFGNTYSFAWWAKVKSSDPMHWGFSDGIRLNGMYTGRLWNTGDSSANPLYIPGTTTQVTAPSTNVWHHYVMTGDGTICKVYLDGVLWAEAKTYKSISGTSIFINGWSSSTDYSSDDLTMSDFRIYATALTADQVKELYSTVASLSDNGTLFANEFIEM